MVCSLTPPICGEGCTSVARGAAFAAAGAGAWAAAGMTVAINAKPAAAPTRILFAHRDDLERVRHHRSAPLARGRGPILRGHDIDLAGGRIEGEGAGAGRGHHRSHH